ncbi:MAG: hypothetical protein IPP97_26475 [Candidatus Obscuribacter sp.]|jgi:hypothetical protein|nr:hypothetical protein [Candidatus Obscuribacter sp.]MDQ5964831.1 hypothetical protein [Cyanobacteriota bacterium erpe_2018_sw_39hr_WHONDRS-SW48-000098_B_bin.30]MBL0189276.1 hypothetical protein [Candidatus Obscuribacter sp.]MBP6348448.1 hypothetical protein [Candidatus Obscuribacter sp.]MBP6592395.1 hypothetical protein [Candidatus Obscuribacter sp.]
MTLCPIALMVHCTGCPLVKFCPAKTIIGDFGKTSADKPPHSTDSKGDDENMAPGDDDA